MRKWKSLEQLKKEADNICFAACALVDIAAGAGMKLGVVKGWAAGIVFLASLVFYMVFHARLYSD